MCTAPAVISKLLAPAPRIGWVLAPERYQDAVPAAKRDTDLGNATLPRSRLNDWPHQLRAPASALRPNVNGPSRSQRCDRSFARSSART
jgi:predicted ATPase